MRISFILIFLNIIKLEIDDFEFISAISTEGENECE